MSLILNRKPVALIALAFIFLGFTWPWSESDSNSSPNPNSKIPASNSKSPPAKPSPARKSSAQKQKGEPVKKKQEDNKELEALQSEIAGMLKINETLKPLKQVQAAEIQRITEQAQIHQRILRNLQTVSPVYQVTDTDRLLRQEKIRLIQEQTLRNRQVLSQIAPAAVSPPTVNTGNAAVMDRAQSIRETQDIINSIERSKKINP